MSLRPNPVSGVNEQQDSLFLTARRRPLTADAHLDQSDQVVLVDCSARPITVVLPRASAVRFRGFILKKIDASANRLTVSAGGGSLIDGALNVTIGGAFNGVWVWSSGYAYFVLPSAAA